MKTLIVFYSRTGTTKKVAENLAQKLGADVEEIADTVDRSGIVGYMKAGRDAMKKKLTVIGPITKNPADYGLVIIGTPNWGRHMAAAIRTYITQQKDKIKKAAFFCLQGGSGAEKLFLEMEEVLSMKPEATLIILTREVPKSSYSEKMEKFISQLNNINQGIF